MVFDIDRIGEAPVASLLVIHFHSYSSLKAQFQAVQTYQSSGQSPWIYPAFRQGESQDASDQYPSHRGEGLQKRLRIQKLSNSGIGVFNIQFPACRFESRGFFAERAIINS